MYAIKIDNISKTYRIYKKIAFERSFKGFLYDGMTAIYGWGSPNIYCHSVIFFCLSYPLSVKVYRVLKRRHFSFVISPEKLSLFLKEPYMAYCHFRSPMRC